MTETSQSSGSTVRQKVPTEHDRPLCFITVVWGESFRNYLTDFPLRSLLAPGNLPADIGRQKRILICGPREDWEALRAHEVVEAVRRFAEVEWIDFEPVRHRQIRSMSIGLSLCLKRAAEQNAYVSQFPPDSVYFDGAVTRLGEYIDQGLELVLTPAFRCEEEALFEDLDLDWGGGSSPIVRTADALNTASVRCLHSQMLVTDIDSDFFYTRAHNFHVRGDKNVWMVSKTMAWVQTLMDLSGISEELLEEAGRSVLDSYILAKMYDPDVPLRFVTDPSEYAIVSWAPADWSALPTRGKWYQRMPWLKRVFNDYAVRRSLRYHLTWNNVEDDWIKRRALVETAVCIGNADRYSTQMHTALERLDQLLRGSCADLLQVGPTTPYMKGLDLVDSVSRKATFIFDAILNRDNGRARLVRRAQAFSRQYLALRT